jgi:O-antigen/teichoic acid export membrane protein
MDRGIEAHMRLKNAFRNSFFGVVGQLLIIIVGFFAQRVMNLYMGEELVGLNGVISNVIAMLSVTELGLATAVVFHLYGALAAGDEERIAGLMNLYRRAYTVIAGVILLLGAVTLPWFHVFVANAGFSRSYIRLIYGLWIIKTAGSYLLSYQRSILIADQREYVVSIVTLLINGSYYIASIVVLRLFQRFEWVLAISIVIELLLNLWLWNYVNGQYPYLVKYRKKPLAPGLVRTIWGDIRNIFVTRVSTKLLTCTDNLIISGFISVATVGLYSNYCLITQSVLNVTQAFTNALQPSVGNLFVERDNRKNADVLGKVTFIIFWWGSFAAASLMGLISPFVGDWWLESRYELGTSTVVLCVLNCFAYIIALPLGMVMGVTGLFDREKKLSVMVAAVNLAVSLGLVKPLGLNGVLIGTFAAYCVQICYRMSVFFRVYLGQSPVTYGVELAQYVLLSVAEAALAYFATRAVYVRGSLVRFALMLAICIAIPNGINLLVYGKSRRLGEMRGLVRRLLQRGQQDERHEG